MLTTNLAMIHRPGQLGGNCKMVYCGNSESLQTPVLMTKLMIMMCPIMKKTTQDHLPCFVFLSALRDNKVHQDLLGQKVERVGQALQEFQHREVFL